MRITWFYWVKTEINCTVFWIKWMIVGIYLGCVMHLRSVKFYYRIGLTKCECEQIKMVKRCFTHAHGTIAVPQVRQWLGVVSRLHG